MNEEKTEILELLDKVIFDLTTLKNRTSDLIARLERKV
jgi:hypothetical protein